MKKLFEKYIDAISKILYYSHMGIDKKTKECDTCCEVECKNCLFEKPNEHCTEEIIKEILLTEYDENEEVKQ